MRTPTTDALHDVHTATHDVLTGYREMRARAEPEIQAVIQRLTTMHERHAAEQTAELVRLRDAGQDDTSIQGTVNKVVVILRDWVSELDRDVLPAVRRGEEAVLKSFDETLRAIGPAADTAVATLLRAQRAAIHAEIGRLPQD